MEPKIDLSVCYIVRNEEENLRDSLNSIKGAADEIVVVDTGSEDTTPEIAQELGAYVIKSEWCNDFSCSRNISIDNAHGEWILWLDGDDYVPQESAARISELKRRRPDCVYGMVVRNQRPNGTGTEFIQARMFPNLPEIRFERRIHEQILPSAVKAGYNMNNTDIVIEHHGYLDADTMKKKAKRNSDMLELEYKDAGPDPYMAVEAGDAFWITEDYDKALDWYKEAIDASSRQEGAAEPESQAYYGMGRIMVKNGSPEKGVYYYSKALESIEDRPDVLYMMALALEENGERGAAVNTLKRIIDLPVRMYRVGVDFRSVKIKSYLKLFDMFREDNSVEEMNTLCEKALSRLPGRVEIFNMYGVCKLYSGKLVDALHMFEKSINIDTLHNINAFIGLCVIYNMAGKGDAVNSSLKTMEKLFRESRRYKAFRMIISGMESEAEGAEDMESEINYLKKTYGKDSFPFTQSS